MAIRVEATRLEAMAIRVEATRLEAIIIRLEAIAIRNKQEINNGRKGRRKVSRPKGYHSSKCKEERQTKETKAYRQCLFCASILSASYRTYIYIYVLLLFLCVFSFLFSLQNAF